MFFADALIRSKPVIAHNMIDNLQPWILFLDAVCSALYQAAEEMAFSTCGPSTGPEHLRL